MPEIYDSEKLQDALKNLAEQISKALHNEQAVAIVGIRSRGDILANRLAKLLKNKNINIAHQGILDITLYRDDLDKMGGRARVRATEINFDVTDCVILLVDDVLFTGRTVRSALDALIDLGRPKAIRLAVLVDRGGRELPIQADFVGLKLPESNPSKHVQVLLKETDGEDKIILRN